MMLELDITHEEFVDLCIMLGCDYTHGIDGVGPATAFKLIKEHSTLERVIEYI